MFIVSPVLKVVQDLCVFTWDFGLVLVNAVTPSRKIGHVTPEGTPGAGGKWPEYVPPKESDSRCSCPALNAMANHGESYDYPHLTKVHPLKPLSLFLDRHPPTRWQKY